MTDDLVNATEYEGETTITLSDTDAALVITTDEIQVYMPRMEAEDMVPVHVLLVTGVSIMMTNEDFLRRVLEVVDAAVGEMG